MIDTPGAGGTALKHHVGKKSNDEAEENLWWRCWNGSACGRWGWRIKIGSTNTGGRSTGQCLCWSSSSAVNSSTQVFRVIQGRWIGKVDRSIVLENLVGSKECASVHDVFGSIWKRPSREWAHVNGASPSGSRSVTSSFGICVVSIGSESRVLTHKKKNIQRRNKRKYNLSIHSQRGETSCWKLKWTTRAR